MNEDNLIKTVIDLGRSIAHSCARNGPVLSLTFPFSLLSLENYSAKRSTPRLTVRDQFKVVDLSQAESGYWYETDPENAHETQGGLSALPEFQRPLRYCARPDLHQTSAWILVDAKMLGDPEVLTSVIAARLIPRLFTAENYALIAGPHGLLDALRSGRRDDRSSDPGERALAACNAVEQQGATAAGMLLNPQDYWRILQTSGVIGRLEASGVRITRTRVVPEGEGIVGDFDLGTRLFEAGSSAVRITRHDGRDDQDGLFRVEATFEERLIVGLPRAAIRFRI